MTAPLPFAWGVLYARPNANGLPKRCDNCVFWTLDYRCLIHAPFVAVEPDMICGYHIEGTPQEKYQVLPGIQHVLPQHSGLEDVSDVGGSVCANCRYFENVSEADGLCHAVSGKDGKPPENVKSLGCCARWERLSS
jgi:hypothetical protein